MQATELPPHAQMMKFIHCSNDQKHLDHRGLPSDLTKVSAYQDDWQNSFYQHKTHII